MSRIDLPRALQDYFAFAETDATRNGRRFSITLPYLNAQGRIDRLQWWYHLSPAQEKSAGNAAFEPLRIRAIERFSQHIERWLQNTRQVLVGRETIPCLLAEPDADAEPGQGTHAAPDEVRAAASPLASSPLT